VAFPKQDSNKASIEPPPPTTQSVLWRALHTGSWKGDMGTES
jgi:hypothetical protein